MEFFNPAPKASSINLPSLVTGNNWGQNNGKYSPSFSILFYNILKSLLDHTRPFLADPSSSGRPLCMYFQDHMAEATLSVFPFLLRLCFILALSVLMCSSTSLHRGNATPKATHTDYQHSISFQKVESFLPKL